jgi:hypothetical protein
VTVLDQIFASLGERRAARDLGKRTIFTYGQNAESHLEEKLADPRRNKSLRTVRLALSWVRKHKDSGPTPSE